MIKEFFNFHINRYFFKTLCFTKAKTSWKTTLLNLFNLYDHPSYYVGEDALDDSYSGYVFFNDYTWYDGKRYVDASGNVVKGLQATDDYINNMATKINELIKKNDQVLKTNYFKILKNKKTINS